MVKESSKHEKVKFRQQDVAALDEFPSAQQSVFHPAIESKRRYSFFRWLIVSGFLVAGILLVIGIFSWFLVRTGLESQNMTEQINRQIQSNIGERYRVILENAKLGLDPENYVSLQLDEVLLQDSQSDTVIGKANSVGIGLTPSALLRGELEVRNMNISGVNLIVAGNHSSPNPVTYLLDQNGVADSKLLHQTVVIFIEKLIDEFEQLKAGFIDVSDLSVSETGSESIDLLSVRSLKIFRSSVQEFKIDGSFNTFGIEFDIAGTFGRKTSDEIVFEVSLSSGTIDLPDFSLDRSTQEPLLNRTGNVNIRISGNGLTESSGKITVSLTASQFPNNGENDEKKILVADVEVGAQSEKLEISRLMFAIGRSVFGFNGAIERNINPTDDASYRFNLVGNNLLIAPLDSPEPPVTAAVRIAGVIDKSGRKINANDFALRTRGGEVIGQAQAFFPRDKAPALFLSLRVPKIPVAHAKQIWPTFAASGARRWTMNNVFGGVVRDSRIEVSVGPGRFGSGVPLTPDEISGYFKVENTRFDTAGDIPPVRDAYGTITFNAADVDITLESGTAFMPGGRTVEASRGTLSVRQGNVLPVIGNLEIDISGEADAVAELSGRQPIDALRYVDFEPEDLSGYVVGHVIAEIPLSQLQPKRRLEWDVKLKFKDIALAKGLDGQSVKDATGTLDLTPDGAIIEASANLNGLPANVSITEPLGGSDVEGRRDIAFVLDDKARQGLAPGLNTLLSGPIAIKLGSAQDGTNSILADLENAEVRIPWLGWRKGVGVPANAQFRFQQDSGTAIINNFELKGASFEIDGDFLLNGNQLSKANLNRVQLNRDDNFSAKIDRKSNGYEINLTGKTMDLRSVLKKYRPDREGSVFNPGVPVAVNALLASVVGYNGERLTDFVLELNAEGSAIERLTVRGATSSGKPLEVDYNSKNPESTFDVNVGDAGSFVRFLNIYDRMEGGIAALSLSRNGNGPFLGELELKDFWLINEPQLNSLASSAPTHGDRRSLNDVLPKQIDTGRVKFDRAYALIVRDDDQLSIDRGILSGPTVGATFNGIVSDQNGNMALNGTFMPAYQLNSALSNIPILGFVLGNGRDRGLIGVTFRLTGKFSAPIVQINPLSVIAPGIFRSIFEFR